ncbi:MAG TPA: quinolinate synthase NadA [Smithella sp.]|jgi:quinolinate synthase|nr:quinolinate synthase NadA [Smithella sp.]HOS13219.1 quinolinate synthase NadA [Smithella sp.]HPH54747.1 quinolinate synthase NadA [Smithella sp.]HPL48343.1 quinolinate synthase NadA [Smithella sp.]HPX29661.1 quinolinate synthase NadA [Smithella sp.]
MTIVDRINKLKQEKNAIILAHNYELPEIQDIADFVGDSLGLSMEAAKTDADIIVFCGVRFMAETAKILSPQKTVLLPDKDAGCAMADMIEPEGLRALQSRHPGAVTMCYVNSSARVKALCDYCCTSANALPMTRKIAPDHRDIIFVPDQNLARYVSANAQCHFIIWEGYCPVHTDILPEHIQQAKRLHPQAKVIVHPECKPEITALADVVTSTEGMSRHAQNSPDKEFIIGTETGILHRLKKENPDKFFYPASDKAICADMKKITLEKVLHSLETLSYEITVAPDIMDKARLSIERMLQTT